MSIYCRKCIEIVAWVGVALSGLCGAMLLAYLGQDGIYYDKLIGITGLTGVFFGGILFGASIGYDMRDEEE